MGNQLPNKTKLSSQITAEQVQKLIDTQEKETALRIKQIELHKLSIDNQHDYAKTIIASQVADRENERKNAYKLRIANLIAAGILCLLFFLFLGYAIYKNQPEIAYDIIKAIVVFAGGAFSGYGYAKSRK